MEVVLQHRVEQVCSAQFLIQRAHNRAHNEFRSSKLARCKNRVAAMLPLLELQGEIHRDILNTDFYIENCADKEGEIFSDRISSTDYMGVFAIENLKSSNRY